MIDQGRLIAQIVLGVCELRKCQANSILAPRRHKEAMYNRMLVYLIAHDYCQLSYSGIARVLNRDHTTVIHGVKRAIGEYETNADFRKDYIQLTQEVRLWMEQQLSTTSTSRRTRSTLMSYKGWTQHQRTREHVPRPHTARYT